MWTLALFSLLSSALAGDLVFGLGADGTLTITPPRALTSIQVVSTGGGRTTNFEHGALSAGQSLTVTLPPGATEVEAHVYAVFADGYVEDVKVPITLEASGSVEIDLSRAVADLEKRTLTVKIIGSAERATIREIGAHKKLLDEYSVELGGQGGNVAIPFHGDPKEVVLLEVKVESGNAWSGFTFSPWFLDIPHEDVLFASNSADIPPDETYKLEHTLRELQDVLDKYGDVVPVKLYIAGCTDTVGSADHNLDLSRRRARSIASWLRSHGYDRPIYFHGFGESFLAVRTGDGVDNAANRRVLYLVGANPPPASTGVPSARWSAL